MALNDKKQPFGFDVEERIKSTRTTHTHTHHHTHNEPEEVIRERKTRRIQVLTYDSLINRIDAHAKKKGLSRAELIEQVMAEYLDEHGG